MVFSMSVSEWQREKATLKLTTTIDSLYSLQYIITSQGYIAVVIVVICVAVVVIIVVVLLLLLL